MALGGCPPGTFCLTLGADFLEARPTQLSRARGTHCGRDSGSGMCRQGLEAQVVGRGGAPPPGSPGRCAGAGVS